MDVPHKFIAVGVDESGGVWTYTFPTLSEAKQFVDAVSDLDWAWDIRSTDGVWTVDEAIENHRQAINYD